MSWNIAPGIEKSGIERRAAPRAGQRAPVEDAAGMVKQQRRFRVPHEIRDLPRPQSEIPSAPKPAVM
jgi:hypothetical protein